MKNFSSVLMLLLICAACTDAVKEPEQSFWETLQPFNVWYNTFSMPVTQKFDPLPVKSLNEVELSEASGLAVSNVNPGKVWSHNDSGNPNTIFLIDSASGVITARYQVEGTANFDWEDIEVTIDPQSGKSYLYLADTGDNDLVRTNYCVYRFEEPVFKTEHTGNMVNISDLNVEKINLVYLDGFHDCEALMVDPETLDIFLVTKRDVFSTVYVAPYPHSTDQKNKLYKGGEFPFRLVSSATLSKDGQKSLIRNRQEIFYWERLPGESTLDMLARTPVRAPYLGEVQGEGICFDRENNFYTISEAGSLGVQPFIYKYRYRPN